MAGLFLHADKDMRRKIAALRVLVIDDQNEIRTLVREILSEAGISSIFEASNAEDALGLLSVADDIVNFIICDWNMPGMSGLELLHQVRERHPRMPFLMVTGRGDKTSVLAAKGGGVSAYIRKPFSPRQLEEKLQFLINADPQKR